MPETPVFSTAAVAAPHPRAAEAGQVILASGGNALEAVIAMAATCAVVLPHLNGLAGDGSILVREPRGRVHAIDAAGPAGALATIRRYSAKEYESVPLHGPDATATVAGVVAGWSLGLELSKALGGKLPLPLLLADAINLAREGYAVSRFEAAATMQAELREAPRFADTFLENGEALEPGAIRRQSRLADTLERLAHAGLLDFYRGDVGREIALDLERLGSPIERRDLETYRARVAQPLSMRRNDAEIYNLPAPTDGLASLLALGIADCLPGRVRQGVAYEHWLIEATKRALTISRGHVTDPREVEVEFSDLLTPHFVEREAQQIDVRRAASMSMPLGTTDAGVWIGCIDRDGLAVSYAQSLHGSFGSGCVLPATGLVWNNRAAVFSLDSTGTNPLIPGRKPPNTLHPALAVFADNRVLAYGGGSSAVTAQIFSHYVHSGGGLAGAVQAPRWNLAQRRSDGTVLQMEAGSDPSVMRALGQLGHAVEEMASSDPFGQAGMIVRHARNGRVEAAHDPRIDGSVMGL